MDSDMALRRLAEAEGVEAAGYWDIRGNLHEASPESLRVILGAMGVPANTPSEVNDSLSRIDSLRSRPSPPRVLVRRVDNFSTILATNDGSVGGPAEWRLTTETGEALKGEGDLSALVLPRLPIGRHQLRFTAGDETAETCLVIVPDRCWLPDELAARPGFWGVMAQLYGLRSDRNWGMGDFGDLEALVGWAARAGADVVGVNPLHALRPCDLGSASPYSPTSRFFIEPLYLDMDRIGSSAQSPAAAQAATLREGSLVDYAAVAAFKERAVWETYHSFVGQEAEDRADFERFCVEGGELLRRFATFQVIAEALGIPDWRAWPEALRQAESPEVAHFVRGREDRVGYFSYLQWQADRQLEGVASAARAAGMAIGLYCDLALGAVPGGAETWAAPHHYACQVEIGAPPDDFAREGQAWGLAPFKPQGLEADAYDHFSRLLRANMRRAGALRIDHAMSLRRLFWIPCGGRASEGVYVRYPVEDLLGALALESQRHRCLVIGEDLGTVPEGFRPRMEAAGVISYRVLYFEKEGSQFRPPSQYPSLSSACVATHDLPTLAGFWSGSDLEDRHQAGRLETDVFEEAMSARRQEKLELSRALLAEGLIDAPAGFEPVVDGPLTSSLAAAIHAFVARTNSLLCFAQLEDLAGETHQANVPGPGADFPNWRRRLGLTGGELAQDRRANEILAAIVAERAGPR